MASNRDWNAENKDIIAQFRAHGGLLPGRRSDHQLILLTTTGAKSGLPRINPLNYSTDGDHIIVIASKGGSPTHPDWYHNLVANPEAKIEIGTEKFPVRATFAAGDERARLFNAQAALMPFFAEYQRQATRLIPVVIFERIA